MNDLLAEFEESKLNMLSIGVAESQSSCQAWKEKYNYNFPVLSDLNMDVFNLFAGEYIPHNTILDCNMMVIYTHYGFEESLLRSTIQNDIAKVTAARHIKVFDTEDMMNPIPVNASFNGSSPFINGDPLLFWKTDIGSVFSEITMDPSRWNDYSALIPAQNQETDVFYYIQARNEAGCGRIIPPGAPEDCHRFHIGPDTTPPTIIHFPREQVSIYDLPMTIEADVTDNLGIANVFLDYRINSGELLNLAMGNPDPYTAMIPENLNIGDEIEYRITAVDAAAAGNTTTHPESGFHRTIMVEKIPVLIWDPARIHDSGIAIRDTAKQFGIHVEYNPSQILNNNLDSYRSVFVCLGVLGPGISYLELPDTNLLTDYLNNGGRLYLEGGEAWSYNYENEVYPYFHITLRNPGTNDACSIEGFPETFTDSMCFQYSSSPYYNKSIDRLLPLGDAVPILYNASPFVYNVAIAYDHPVFKTIGSSILFGGLSEMPGCDPPAALMEEMLEFFDVLEDEPTPTPCPTATPGPPSEAFVKIIMNKVSFSTGDPFQVNLRTYNFAESRQIDTYFLLDILGTNYYFWPEWIEPVSCRNSYCPYGTDSTESILDFSWPEGTGSSNGLRFWAGMIDPMSGTLFGDYDVVSWQYD